jgi:hypothetical protein
MLNEDDRDMLRALSDEGVAKKRSRMGLTDSRKSKTAKVKGLSSPTERKIKRKRRG